MERLKPTKNKQIAPIVPFDETSIFNNVAEIIETRKARAGAQVNSEVTLMYWEIGRYINKVLLGNERAEYGKQIVTTLSSQLVARYGRSFEYTNVTRMMRFATRFCDSKILGPLAQQLSWSHIIALLPLKTDEAFMFYAREAINGRLGKRDLRLLIERKAYERHEIADSQFTERSAVPLNLFKDPYLLDTLNLRDNYLEADLEKAILSDIEAFVLEFGRGFSFVERQKRMTWDGKDYTLDLLFFHRGLKRLVAVELKFGAFKPAHKGQMEFYLNWLDKYERMKGEEPPVGIILCASANKDTVELMKLDKAGIAVAEYWTELPPKEQFEEKIRTLLAEAQERIERRRTLITDGTAKAMDFFLESEDEDD